MIGVLFVVYSLVRLAAQGDLSAARGVAREIQNLEAALGIDVERTWNHWLAGLPTLMLILAVWYAFMHWVGTLGMLGFLWWRRPGLYRPMFVSLVATTMAGLALFILLPTAPPRLMPGFVDVLLESGNLGYWDTGSTGPDGLSTVTNELAAFPSLHAAWSLWVCLAVFAATRNLWWRCGGVIYALVTAAVILTTANHWVVDVLAGWALTAASVAIVSRWRRGREPSISVEAPTGAGWT